MYQFTGSYDPVTHEALCADLTCIAPAASEVGEFLGAQMAAANVNVPSVTVTKTGNGSVSSVDRLISCGNKCAAGYNQGDVVNLTASAGSGAVFTGWGGACIGNQVNCTVTATEALTVSANFATALTLQVKTSGGKGLITSNPGGIDCGKTCSLRTVQGTVFNLTAVPEPGFRFVNWTGGCTGTALTCTVTVTGNTAVQANFTK